MAIAPTSSMDRASSTENSFFMVILLFRSLGNRETYQSIVNRQRLAVYLHDFKIYMVQGRKRLFVDDLFH